MGRASTDDGRVPGTDPVAVPRNVVQEVLRGRLGPYARNRVREILHGHRAQAKEGGAT